MVKLVRRRNGPDDFVVYLEGNPAIWEAGRTSAEALFSFVTKHADVLDMEIVWDESDPPTKRWLERDLLARDT